MKIGILKEPLGETRVAILPEHFKELQKLKIEILVEKGAGDASYSFDTDYEQAGAKVVGRSELMTEVDAIISIQPMTEQDLSAMNAKQISISVLNPFGNIELIKHIKNKGLTCFSMDSIPRISRAQDKDILSSMATVAGYRAVLDAAMHLPQFFPMFMTAAGTIKPAKVLIIGVGVAGLQAIATARRLGAQVEAFDVRSATKEQVLSLGAKFVEVEGAREDTSAGGYAIEQSEEFLKKQQQVVQDHAAKANVIITTAQIPGKKAPILITKETIARMTPGSVIVDLAASTGGNCEGTENDKTVRINNVSIIGQSNYAATMPIDASRMYGKNVLNFLKLLVNEEGELFLNWDDEVVYETCITHDHKIYNKRIQTIIKE